MVPYLPELKVLCIVSRGISKVMRKVEKFKPIQGQRYIEKFEINDVLYILEKDGEQPMRYRRIDER
jgi:hypothetical protein